MFLFKHQHPVITILNYSCDYLSNYNLQRDQTPEMADDLDIDDLLEAPYKKPEDAEVNFRLRRFYFKTAKKDFCL